MAFDLEKLLRPLRTRLANMVTRAVVSLVDDSLKLQGLQLQALAVDDSGELLEGVERVQDYGFTSVPLNGAEAVVLSVGGRRDHALAIAVDDRRYRLVGLQDGEVAIYTDQGDSIVIKRGGTIQVTAATAIELGGNSDAVAVASKVDDRISKIWHALSAWAPSGTVADGPALKALLTAVTAADPTFPEATGSSKVKL